MNAPAGKAEKSLELGFQLGELQIEPRAGLVTGPGGRQKLDPKVMGVLVMVAENAGHVVSREDLLARLWPNVVVTNDVLSRCFYELRRQLSLAGGTEDYRAIIETLPKRGHRLNAEVTRIEPPRSSGNGREPWLRWAGIALIGVIAIAAAWFIYGRLTASPPAPSSAQVAASIAVLPFADMSEGQDQGYIADGVADEVLNRLNQAKNLRVLARTSSFALRDSPMDVAEIARKLDVTHVLEGSVRRSGDTVRVTAQLIATADSSHVWSDTFERKRDNLFAIEDEIADAVATALQAALVPREAHARKPPGIEAHDSFLQGEFFYYRRNPGDIERAIKAYEAAVASDADYARAWAALAGAYGLEAWEVDPPSKEFQAKQFAAALKAVALDPSLGVAHMRLGQYYLDTGDSENAERHINDAKRLDPNDLMVLGWAAGEASERGDSAEAVALQRRALAIDPLSPVTNANLAILLLADGQLDEALLTCRKVLALSPGGQLGLHSDIVRILVLQKRFAEAKLAVADLPEGTLRDHGQALLFAAPGERAAADAALQRLIADPDAGNPEQDVLKSIRLAEAYAVRDRLDDALRTLEMRKNSLAGSHGTDSPYGWHLRTESRLSPFLKPLHADPRWQAFVADPK